MKAARVALQVHQRRLERADRVVAQAAELERRREAERGQAEAVVQQARAQAEAEQRRLWADLMGKPCDARAFDELHARLAYMKDQVAALEQQLLAAESALQQAQQALAEARKARARQSARTEKFGQWIVEEEAKLAQAELQRVEDEQADAPRRPARVPGGAEALA